MDAHELMVRVCDEVLPVLESGTTGIAAMREEIDALGRARSLANGDDNQKHLATQFFLNVQWVGEELGADAVRQVRANHARFLG